MDNIILIGMSGVGKTTIGKELSKLLVNRIFVDIDEEIERYSGKTIPEIFEEFGEQFFRVLEKDILNKFLKNGDAQIISTGGGAFEDEFNRKLMFETGTVIYLKSTPEEIFNRVKSADSRPLLKEGFSVEKISDLMNKRVENYEKANIIIDTTGKTPYNITKEILKHV